MTQTRKDSGPAFPIVQEGIYDPEVDGISMRDWFAGQALAGIISGARGSEMSHDDFAIHAYAIADAMLSERLEGGDT